MAAEKTEKALIEGITKFDQAKLKHTETQEKNPLPDKEGTFVFNYFWAAVWLRNVLTALNASCPSCSFLMHVFVFHL